MRHQHARERSRRLVDEALRVRQAAEVDSKLTEKQRYAGSRRSSSRLPAITIILCKKVNSAFFSHIPGKCLLNVKTFFFNAVIMPLSSKYLKFRETQKNLSKMIVLQTADSCHEI